jgi:hypothetical protein
MGQIFNPSPQGFGSLQFLGSNGSSASGVMGNPQPVCSASAMWNATLPPWVASFSDALGGTNVGLISCSVPGAIILFVIEVSVLNTSGTFGDVRLQLLQNVGGGGGSGNNNFPDVLSKNAAPAITGVGNGEWCEFNFTYRFTNTTPPTDNVVFRYTINPTVAGSASTYSQLKAYRVG